MATLKNEMDYRCFEDCKQWGCQGHKMEVTIQNTSEALLVYKDGELWFGADPNEWETLKKLLQGIDYIQFDLSTPPF